MNKIVMIISTLVFYMIPLLLPLNAGLAQSNSNGLINENSTDKTKSLYTNFSKTKGRGVMFGHQDDLALGVKWKFENGRSDIQEVCNDFPAVFGWDVGMIGKQSTNQDGISFDMMTSWMKLTYKSGGINTISWSMDNPITEGPCTDLTPAVASIIPGGEYHDKYKSSLDVFAQYTKQLNIGKGDEKLIPIIFRPFHQSSIEKFWWSMENCQPKDFIELWRFTVEYLNNEKGLENIIYAYSTDAFSSVDEFMEFYPGDEYVDIIGLNLYDTGQQDFALELSKKLMVLNTIGAEYGKVTAITETGYKQVPISTWWTDQLIKGIFTNRSTANISYLMVGKNLSSDHFYAPFPEHSSAENFKQLYQNMYTLFLEDLQDVYATK